MTPFAFHVKTVALKIVCHSLKVTGLTGEADPWLPCARSHDHLPHSPMQAWSSAGTCQHEAASPQTYSLHALSDFHDSHLATSQMGPMERQGFQSFVCF